VKTENWRAMEKKDSSRADCVNPLHGEKIPIGSEILCGWSMGRARFMAVVRRTMSATKP